MIRQAPLARRGIREGDPFCGPVAMRLGVGGSLSGRASLRSRLGAKDLPVEQTI